MSLQVVLFTRSGRPSGAQMALKLIQSGFHPAAVVVEKRSRMLAKQKASPGAVLSQMGWGFVLKKIAEAAFIQIHYYLRKALGPRFQSLRYLSIKELALDYPLRIFEVEDHNGQAVEDLLWRIQPDIGILTNTRKIHESVLKVPRFGFLNLHCSVLPKYAGLDSIFWALYHGEEEIGVTGHCASGDIDQGDIVFQRQITVRPFDDINSLYEKALWLGTGRMIQALQQIERTGAVLRIPQNRRHGSYYSWPTRRDRLQFRRQWREKRKKLIQRDQGKPGIRVMHIITRMIRGGAQENTLATVEQQVRQGYQVTLVSGNSWGNEGELLSRALESGAAVKIIPELVRDPDPYRDAIAFFKILSMLKEYGYDIVHTHTSKAGLLGRLAALAAKIPVRVHTPHGHVFHSYFSKFKESFYLALERMAARKCDALIALTEVERAEHLRLGVGQPGQWSVIPSGVDEKRFKAISEDRKRDLKKEFEIPLESKWLGFIGRLVPVKGAQYFLEAIPHVLRKRSDIHFVFVGDGSLMREFQNKVSEMGLAGRVVFTGHKEEVGEYLAALDLLVVPSLNEGMGRVIVEAGFLAKPVVAARVGGILDLIEDQKTGLLVSVRNPLEIAQAILTLLSEPAYARQLGECLRNKVLNGFTEDQMAEKIHRLYVGLLEKKGIPLPLSFQGDFKDSLQAEESGLRASGTPPHLHPLATGERQL